MADRPLGPGVAWAVKTLIEIRSESLKLQQQLQTFAAFACPDIWRKDGTSYRDDEELESALRGECARGYSRALFGHGAVDTWITLNLGPDYGRDFRSRLADIGTHVIEALKATGFTRSGNYELSACMVGGWAEYVRQLALRIVDLKKRQLVSEKRRPSGGAKSSVGRSKAPSRTVPTKLEMRAMVLAGAGHSYSRIADEMGISRGRVGQLLRSGRSRRESPSRSVNASKRLPRNV